VHDQLATGSKLRVLTIVDTFSRFSPAIEPLVIERSARQRVLVHPETLCWMLRRP
jgi:putative transposase